jgi:hypothetical protein
VEILISFNYDDRHLAEALRASLFVLAPDFDVIQFILSPTSYGAVRLDKNVAAGVYEADVYVLVVGPRGIGRWQVRECEIALERRRNDPSFLVFPVLAAAGSQAPTQDYLRDLDWISMPVVTDRTILR